MSTTTDPQATDGLDLSIDEQWVLHHVMVEHVDRAYDEDESPPWWALSVAGKVESEGDAGPSPNDRCWFQDKLTTFEAWRARRALLEYADSDAAPQADAAIARGIVDRLEGAFEAAPATIR